MTAAYSVQHCMACYLQLAHDLHATAAVLSCRGMLRAAWMQEHVLYSAALGHLVDGKVQWDEASQLPIIVA